ncbi:BNR repeat-like domain-containing protein [Cadophora sp. MPI-SDFR-AT-0126]|nr:BNR repeat-like domain-containing protein [Leotiomycetes sp. MPI-SDFR-AT-0126]
MPSTILPPAPSSPPHLNTTLKVISSDRSECYLPSATGQSHASNLLRLKNGDLLCAWFGGSQEGIPDISTYVSRLPAGTDTWTPAEKLSNDNTRSEQNPVLFQTPSGPLWLLYTSQQGGNQETAIVKRRISNDGGHTWGAVDTLFPEPGTFIRSPMVVLRDDGWVIPTFKCRAGPGERWVGNDDISCVRVSYNQGVTWTETEVPNSYGCVHMAIVPLKTGSYFGVFRSRWADFIYTATSQDGINWSEPKPTELPNPNAGICIDVMPSGRLIMIYNHSSAAQSSERREGLYDDIDDDDDKRNNQPAKHHGKTAFWGAPRAPLSFAASDDEGKTWRTRVIEDGDGYCMTNNSLKKLNRELSYPSTFVQDDGVVHVAFTFWRQKIKYVRLTESFAD